MNRVYNNNKSDNHILSLTLSCDDFINKCESSKIVSQVIIVGGVSLLSGNNGSHSLIQLISDATGGLVWIVTVLVREDSVVVGGAWCGITGGDKGCDGGSCTWAGIVDCWCCLFMSSNYI